jgi:FKBP-type peptidyl-prolyl cis-trans isomerase FklB
MLAIFATQIKLMKKYIVAAFCFSMAAISYAQKAPVKTAPKTPAKTTTAKTSTTAKPATSTTILKTKDDSLSYAIGLSVANFYKQQGIKLNTVMVTRALNDIVTQKKPLLTDDQANLVFMCHSNPQICKNVTEGESYLVKNKKNTNVKTTASGLQYEVVTQGTGMKPGSVDTVTVNYKGTLLNGEEFDNSYKRGQPISFPLNGVIRGWTEGLQLMPVGSKYKFYIPYQLGYGLNDMQAIPGGSVLVFEVELLDVKKAQ